MKITQKIVSFRKCRNPDTGNSQNTLKSVIVDNHDFCVISRFLVEKINTKIFVFPWWTENFKIRFVAFNL